MLTKIAIALIAPKINPPILSNIPNPKKFKKLEVIDPKILKIVKIRIKRIKKETVDFNCWIVM